MSRAKLLAEKVRSLYTGKYALLSNTATACTLGFVADTVSQALETTFSDKEWDLKRTRNMTIMSTTFGPIMHYWYRFLDGKFPGKASRMVFKKIGVDLITIPALYMMYFPYLGMLKGQTKTEIVDDLQNKGPLIVGFDLTLWPFLQYLNFMLLPPHYRIIGVKVNELVLGIITSHIVNNNYSVRELLNSEKNKKE